VSVCSCYSADGCSAGSGCGLVLAPVQLLAGMQIVALGWRLLHRQLRACTFAAQDIRSTALTSALTLAGIWHVA
jgi:hypothetical protein